MTSVSTVRPPGNTASQPLSQSLLRCGFAETLPLTQSTLRGLPRRRSTPTDALIRCRCVFHPLDVLEDGRAPCGHQVAAHPPQVLGADIARLLVGSQALALVPTDAVARWRSQVDGCLRGKTRDQRRQILEAVRRDANIRPTTEAAWAFAALCHVEGTAETLDWLEQAITTLNCPACEGEGEVRNYTWEGYAAWLSLSRREYPNAPAEAHYAEYEKSNGPEFVPCECRGEGGAL